MGLRHLPRAEQSLPAIAPSSFSLWGLWMLGFGLEEAGCWELWLADLPSTGWSAFLLLSLHMFARLCPEANPQLCCEHQHCYVNTHQWATADMGCPRDASCFPATAVCCSPCFLCLLRQQFNLPHSLPPPLVTSLPDCVAVRWQSRGVGVAATSTASPAAAQLLPVVSFSFLCESSPSEGQHNSFKNKQKHNKKGFRILIWLSTAHWLIAEQCSSVGPLGGCGGSSERAIPKPCADPCAQIPTSTWVWAPNVCVLQQESLRTAAPGLTFSNLLGWQHLVLLGSQVS